MSNAQPTGTVISWRWERQKSDCRWHTNSNTAQWNHNTKRLKSRWGEKKGGGVGGRVRKRKWCYEIVNLCAENKWDRLRQSRWQGRGEGGGGWGRERENMSEGRGGGRGGRVSWDQTIPPMKNSSTTLELKPHLLSAHGTRTFAEERSLQLQGYISKHAFLFSEHKIKQNSCLTSICMRPIYTF